MSTDDIKKNAQNAEDKLTEAQLDQISGGLGNGGQNVGARGIVGGVGDMKKDPAVVISAGAVGEK